MRRRIGSSYAFAQTHSTHARHTVRQRDDGTNLWILMISNIAQMTTTTTTYNTTMAMAISATLHAHYHHCVQFNFFETRLLSAGPTNSLRYMWPFLFSRHRQHHPVNRKPRHMYCDHAAQCSLLMHGYWLQTHHQFRYDSVARLPHLWCVIPTLNFLLFSFRFFCFLSFYWHFLDWCDSHSGTQRTTNICALSSVCVCVFLFLFWLSVIKDKILLFIKYHHKVLRQCAETALRHMLSSQSTNAPQWCANGTMRRFVRIELKFFRSIFMFIFREIRWPTNKWIRSSSCAALYHAQLGWLGWGRWVSNATQSNRKLITHESVLHGCALCFAFTHSLTQSNDIIIPRQLEPSERIIF